MVMQGPGVTSECLTRVAPRHRYCATSCRYGWSVQRVSSRSGSRLWEACHGEVAWIVVGPFPLQGKCFLAFKRCVAVSCASHAKTRASLHRQL